MQGVVGSRSIMKLNLIPYLFISHHRLSSWANSNEEASNDLI